MLSLIIFGLSWWLMKMLHLEGFWWGVAVGLLVGIPLTLLAALGKMRW